MQALGSLLWGSSEPTPEERAQRIAEFRAVLAAEGAGDAAATEGGAPDLTASALAAREEDLEAFLVARGGDLEAASEMWRESQAWRRRTFPIARTEAIERILSSSRFRDMGFNVGKPSRLVVIFDAQWGKFLEGEDEEDLISAFLLHFDEQLAKTDAQGVYSLIHLATGGPPPMDWIRKLTAILEANYPERLHKAVLFPVPWLLGTIVRGVLCFLPTRTQEKFELASDVAALASACCVEEAAIPEDLRATDPQALVDHASQLQASGQAIWVETDAGHHRAVLAAYVSAGGIEELKVSLDDPVAWLEWDSGVDEGYDVGLAIKFESQKGPDSPQVLREASKFQDATQGERIALPGAGLLRFEFDNSYSWLNGKNVCVEVRVKKLVASSPGTHEGSHSETTGGAIESVAT